MSGGASTVASAKALESAPATASVAAVADACCVVPAAWAPISAEMIPVYPPVASRSSVRRENGHINEAR